LSSLFNIKHDGAHVVERFRLRQFARGTNDGTRRTATCEFIGERDLVEHIENAVGAKHRDVAVFQLAFKKCGWISASKPIARSRT